MYRLTEVTYPDMEVDTYTYDAVGNRLTKDSDDYTYDAADQLTDLEGVTFDYDENGNQTDRDSDTFDYDHENRLIESVIDSVTSTSEYNGDGLRMSHTVGMTTTSYVWDVASGLPVVLQDGENTYVYGLDLISATDSQGGQTYFLYDGLGSTTELLDDTGDVTDAYTYDVFGAIRASSGSSANPWLFTGEQQDEDSGLQYLRARYYDPETGRFMSTDPISAGYPYAYVGNSPVNFTDPSGLHCRPWHPHHCPGEIINLVSDFVECLNNLAVCAVDQFVGSAIDKKLVEAAGEAAKLLAQSPSISKEGGINLIQNCGSAFCKGLFTATQTPNCVTIATTILCKRSCAPGTGCFKHESTHVDQYREFGLLGFYEEYFKHDPKNALKCLVSGGLNGLLACVYHSRPLEKEAEEAAGR